MVLHQYFHALGALSVPMDPFLLTLALPRLKTTTKLWKMHHKEAVSQKGNMASPLQNWWVWHYLCTITYKNNSTKINFEGLMAICTKISIFWNFPLYDIHLHVCVFVHVQW